MIPILILTYNRPDCVLRLVSALVELHKRQIFVSIDGPRNDFDKKKQEEIIKILEEFKNNFDEIHVITRKSNLGCNLGVVSGIDWFFLHVDEGIILEDDCIPSKEFFTHIDIHRNSTKLNSRNGMVTAYNPLNKMHSSNRIESRYSFITGWFTRGDIWKVIRRDLYRINRPKRKNRYSERQSISEMVFWWAAATRARLDCYDTWDSSFSMRMWENGYKCIIPQNNCVTNIGYGSGATHTTDPAGTLFLDGYAELELESKDFDSLVRDHYFKIKTRHILTPLFRLFLDLARSRKPRNLELTLENNLEFQQTRVIR